MWPFSLGHGRAGQTAKPEHSTTVPLYHSTAVKTVVAQLLLESISQVDPGEGEHE